MEHRTQNNQYGIQDTGRSAFRVPRSAQAGMSLLELLIYIAILSGLMVVISDAFIMLAKGRGQAEARSEVNSAVRFAAERIKQDVKNAGAISTPVLGTPANTLSLTVSGVPVVYDMLGGALRRTENGVVATTTGSLVSVDTPTFTRLENYNPNIGASGATTTAVQVVMTFQYNSSSTDWRYTDTLRTTITFR
ncbi:MAG: Prepilin-type cleavage/methylation-like protein [Parcubacteria group bacterium GW2011_GWA1_47_8]|nr:MAG: Prepilin-type cleavage/methylation-like protein [Parcubacteria group bacterium GW2011_GWA1_47_8]